MKYFCNTLFCFVLCIHLVRSCSSLLMFVSYFSVYLIIILMCLFTFLFIHLLILSIKTWISLLICLFIIFLWIYTVSKNSDFVIYLSKYLCVCLFIYINSPTPVHTQFVYFLLVSAIFRVFIKWNVDSFKRIRSVVRGELKYVYRFLNLQESEVRKKARFPEKSV